MKLIKKLLLVLFVWQAVAVPFFVFPIKVQAQGTCVGSLAIDLQNFPGSNTFIHGSQLNPDPTVSVGGLQPDTQYFFTTKYLGGGPTPDGFIRSEVMTSDSSGSIQFAFTEQWWDVTDAQDWFDLTAFLKIQTITPSTQDLCKVFDFSILRDNTLTSCEIEFSQDVNGQPCWGCLQANKTTNIKITMKDRLGNPYSGTYWIEILPEGIPNIPNTGIVNGGILNITKTLALNDTLEIYVKDVQIGTVRCSRSGPMAVASCDPTLACTNPSPTDPNQIIPYELCKQIQDSTAYQACVDCATGGAGGSTQDPGGVWTAIGCIDRNPEAIIVVLITIGLSMGGGVALLMILIAGFILSTSQGDPKRTGEAKEMVTAAVIGLIFVIFSVTILQFIGVTVLQIPGFGG